MPACQKHHGNFCFVDFEHCASRVLNRGQPRAFTALTGKAFDWFRCRLVMICRGFSPWGGHSRPSRQGLLYLLAPRNSVRFQNLGLSCCAAPERGNPRTFKMRPIPASHFVTWPCRMEVRTW